MSEIVDYLLSFAVSYPEIISFIGALLGGESLMLLLGTLAGEGLLSIWKIYIFSLLGVIFFDSMWFLIGKNLPSKKFNKIKNFHPAFKKAEKHLNRIAGKSKFKTLLITKFIYGARIASIIYLGRKNLALTRFIIYNLIISGFIVFLAIGIGWLAGKGIGNYIDLFENARILLTFFIILIIAFNIGRHYINKAIEKREKRLK